MDEKLIAAQSHQNLIVCIASHGVQLLGLGNWEDTMRWLRRYTNRYPTETYAAHVTLVRKGDFDV